MINLQSIRFQPSWQDIPCASRRVRGFACEHEAVTTNPTEPEIQVPTSMDTCQDHMFTCGDGTCILSINLCDDVQDCPDKSDESQEQCGEVLFITVLITNFPDFGRSNLQTFT